MALHLTKGAFGHSNVEGLAERLKARGEEGPLFLTTRYLPKRHEEIAGLLQWVGGDESVPALRAAAEAEFAYRDFDDSRTLTRRCVWALSDIRTPGAVAALEALAGSAVPRVRELAEYHLAKVRNGEPRSPGRRRLHPSE